MFNGTASGPGPQNVLVRSVGQHRLRTWVILGYLRSSTFVRTTAHGNCTRCTTIAADSGSVNPVDRSQEAGASAFPEGKWPRRGVRQSFPGLVAVDTITRVVIEDHTQARRFGVHRTPGRSGATQCEAAPVLSHGGPCGRSGALRSHDLRHTAVAPWIAASAIPKEGRPRPDTRRSVSRSTGTDLSSRASSNR
jgi:hypothetical protein